MLTVGSLFSGIGGLDLGLERAGMQVIWQSEIDPYACKVLAKHWKDVPNHGNIKEIDWRDVVRPDVICGGYPCQPFSTAGKRNGTEDPRHLWPWVREAISILRPRYAILENVRGHVSLGLDIVLREMASIGYDAEWQIVSANSVGAPHLRERIIIVAYPVRQLADSDSLRHLHSQSEIFTAKRWVDALSHIAPSGKNVANTDDSKLDDVDNGGIYKRTHEQRRKVLVSNHASSCIRRADSNWSSEPNVGRVAHGIPSRVDRLKGLGNAVVPQVAELVGRMVVDYDNQ
jgi:DNA (cytosine-5)-methyltransferase 1